MQNPPICNYEGSDYQQSFWDQGSRAYEDAVEAIALKRLLPQSGSHLLELGAGAGRNTPRYKQYSQVTLVDYSSTQLQQARQRLGESGHYRFVAADIYHLPFVQGVFDGATMIRTLHHMAEPLMALQQVRRALQPGAVFILEYANKRNVKSMLRYLLRRQTWSPYAPEQVEFAALNFDFHPKTVDRLLSESGFRPERTLTVSHFRMGVLKKLIPLKALVWLDSLLQPTGSWIRVTPSVFTRTAAVGETPLSPASAFFQCPACASGTLADTSPELHCSQCGRTYPVKDGIYDFRLDQEYPRAQV
ncbi:MAG: methyltransferase domain-containing protein [Anaerolineaceae bacterium]|nr:methyltransferase domain-containing protein [Anaerolineaceae bacterium]